MNGHLQAKSGDRKPAVRTKPFYTGLLVHTAGSQSPLFATLKTPIVRFVKYACIIVISFILIFDK